MTVYYNGQPIEVIPQYDEDDNLILFKGNDRNYNLGEVIYDGCPQTKYKTYK
jgi:hypothetical protein